MAQLNGKLMEEKLKKGWTVTSFSEYFKISETEFLKRLRTTFTEKTYNSMLKRLERNKKIQRKTGNCHQSKDSHAEPLINTDSHTDSNEELHQQELSCMETLSSLSNNSEQKEVDRLSQLKSMKTFEKNLSEVIAQLEVESKSFITQKHALKSALLEEKKALERFLRDLSLRKENIEKIFADYNSLSVKCSENNSQLRNKKQKLQELREQIKELEKIQIFFYEDGEIEFVNGENFETSDEDCNRIFKEIIVNPLLEKCTVRVIKQLAKLLVLTKYFSQLNLNYSITFENQDIESLFKNISSK